VGFQAPVAAAQSACCARTVSFARSGVGDGQTASERAARRVGGESHRLEPERAARRPRQRLHQHRTEHTCYGRGRGISMQSIAKNIFVTAALY
jgi:hypothetical protein